jgi:hypothetical protein
MARKPTSPAKPPREWRISAIGAKSKYMHSRSARLMRRENSR